MLDEVPEDVNLVVFVTDYEAFNPIRFQRMYFVYQAFAYIVRHGGLARLLRKAHTRPECPGVKFLTEADISETDIKAFVHASRENDYNTEHGAYLVLDNPTEYPTPRPDECTGWYGPHYVPDTVAHELLYHRAHGFAQQQPGRAVYRFEDDTVVSFGAAADYEARFRKRGDGVWVSCSGLLFPGDDVLTCFPGVAGVIADMRDGMVYVCSDIC